MPDVIHIRPVSAINIITKSVIDLYVHVTPGFYIALPTTFKLHSLYEDAMPTKHLR